MERLEDLSVRQIADLWRQFTHEATARWEGIPDDTRFHIAIVGLVALGGIIVWYLRSTGAAETSSLPGAACPVCGARALPGYRFCGHCGAPLASGDLLASGANLPSAMVPASPPTMGGVPVRPIRQRPTWVVIWLTICTLGFYWLVWFAQTWSELKRYLGNSRMLPAGHALALYVPLYSWNRVWAHYRLINEQATARGEKRAIDPGGAVLGFLLPVIKLLTGTLVMVSGQRALNRVWAAAYGPASEKRACAGEWVAALAVPLVVLASFASIATSPYASRFAATVAPCQGWNAYLAEHDRLIAEETALWQDFDSVPVPSTGDWRRWSSASRSLRLHYQQVAPPPALAAFVAQQIDGYRNYEDGFRLVADGQTTVGNSRLAAGDRSLNDVDKALASANALCVARTP